jgi:methionyl aminopeptidase
MNTRPTRIKHYGARSAFLGYRKYPCHVCISVNEQVVHGLAGDRRVQFGDIVSLDVGVVYNGFIGDNARTVPVGGCDLPTQRLMDVTERRCSEGIAQASPGNRVADISRAIQSCVEGNGLLSCVSLWGMASAVRCTRSRKCRILSRANHRRSCVQA